MVQLQLILKSKLRIDLVDEDLQRDGYKLQRDFKKKTRRFFSGVDLKRKQYITELIKSTGTLIIRCSRTKKSWAISSDLMSGNVDRYPASVLLADRDMSQTNEHSPRIRTDLWILIRQDNFKVFLSTCYFTAVSYFLLILKIYCKLFM